MNIATLNRRNFGIGAIFSLAALGECRTLPALAQATPEPAMPELIVVAKDFSFDMPATIPSGFTAVTMENQGTVDHLAIFIKLNQGVTLDDAQAAETPLDLSKLGDSFGGPIVAPGGRQTTVIDLEDGSYVVACVVTVPDGIAHYHKGMIAPLEVTANNATGAAPAADLKIELIEMMFHELPDTLPAGSSVWEIENTGTTIHEMVVFKLDHGITGDQVVAMLLGPPPNATPGAAPSGPPPFTAVGATSFISPGRTIYVTLDLVPGTYLAVCFWHDVWGGQAHAELGMTQTFTVG